jgi:multicomponent Na+:H+ antiporter subunit B
MTGMMNGDTGVAIATIIMLTMLFCVAIAIARLRNLFAIVMLAGVYSLISAAWYVAVDAVDVGFTEAAVGAGMSTVVLLGAMLLTARSAKPEKPLANLGPFLVCAATAVMLIYGTIDLPAIGDPDSPANSGVGRTYLEVNWFDTGIPHVVTTVLSSYRGFDTLGEVAVVFAAAIGAALMLGFGERSLADTLRRERNQRPEGEASREKTEDGA